MLYKRSGDRSALASDLDTLGLKISTKYKHKFRLELLSLKCRDIWLKYNDDDDDDDDDDAKQLYHYVNLSMKWKRWCTFCWKLFLVPRVMHQRILKWNEHLTDMRNTLHYQLLYKFIQQLYKFVVIYCKAVITESVEFEYMSRLLKGANEITRQV